MSKKTERRQTVISDLSNKPNKRGVIFEAKTGNSNVTFTYFNLNGTSYQITDYAFAILGPAAVIGKASVIFNSERGRREYFFTRNNISFVAILEYIENGELHMPLSVCPLAFQKEMSFWGIKLQALETCCKRRLLEHTRTERLLDDFSHSFNRPHLKTQKTGATYSWENVRRHGWDILDDPSSSNWAKLYFAIKAMAVLIFVFESVASTHNFFQYKLSNDEIHKYIDDNKAAFNERCQVEEDKKAIPSLRFICNILHNSMNQSLSLQKRDVREYNINNYGNPIDADYSTRKPLVDKVQYSDDNVSNYLLYQQRHYKQRTTSAFNINDGSVQLLKQVQQDKDTPRIKPTAYLLDRNLKHSNQTISTPRNIRPKRNVLLDLNKMRVGKLQGDNQDTADDIHTSDNIGILKPFDWLKTLEFAMGLYFVVEYLLELIFAPHKLSYVLSFYSVVDLINIICGAWLYIYYELRNPEFKHTGNQFELLNAIVSIKTLKLFTVVKDLRGFRVLMFSVRTSYKDVLSFMLYLIILVMIPSFFMYYLEKENMESIPGAMWWAVVTVTTVGYGDKVPHTGMGRLLGVVCAISGILVLALFVPLFVNDFMIFNKFSKEKHNKKRNPLNSLMTRLHSNQQVAFT